MTEYEEIKRVIEQIVTISPNIELSKYIPLTSSHSSLELRLQEVAKKIVNRENPPLVLWNVQPWNTFNILHAIYCHKLKNFIEIGFNCQIIIYDKLVEKKNHIPNRDRIYLDESIKNCIKWFKSAGLKEEKTEFLTESDIMSFIKFEEFAESITTLGHIIGFDKNWSQKEGTVSFIMDRICEIYYENLINCDILLTGEADMQEIWRTARSEIIDRNLPNYRPPLILYYPTIIGIDGLPLVTDNNSLSIYLNDRELRENIVSSPEHFLKTIFDFLIIPSKGKIRNNEDTFYSFEELKKELSRNKINELAFDFMKDYFTTIRGGQL